MGESDQRERVRWPPELTSKAITGVILYNLFSLKNEKWGYVGNSGGREVPEAEGCRRPTGWASRMLLTALRAEETVSPGRPWDKLLESRALGQTH